MLRLAVLPLSTAALFAQATGSISGTVRDSTGAVIPSASVTATNTGTNQSRTATTGSTGQYVFPLLPVGSYEVRVEAQGFTPFVQQGIILQANTQIQADAAMQVASANTQVTVSSEAALIQTTSSTLVQVVDQKRVNDLPLNGRNVLQLVSLNAGVSDRKVPRTLQGVNLGFGAYQNTTSMNGARGTSTNYLLDNADHNEAQTNLAQVFPNVDAVQEFSVQTSSFDAQYGRGVGGVINVATKSGTNQFHGSMFEFFRNFKLNAANFFSGRDALKRNQYGASAGGPVRKDNTFFFASWQGTRIRSATPGALRTSPSQQMKAGDYSQWNQPIRDPRALETVFPNNQIPRSRFDPVAAKILESVPASNDPRYQIRFGTPTSVTSDEQGVVRLDHELTSKHRLSARYFVFRYDNPAVMIPDNLLYAVDGQQGYSHSLSFNHAFTVTPRWLNNLNVSYNWSGPERLTSLERFVTLKALGARVEAPPGVNLLSVTINGWSGMSLGNSGINETNSFHLANAVSYATGRHNLRFGGDVRRYRTGFISNFLTAGQTGSTGQFLSLPGRQVTGHSYAEFTLGVTGTWRQTSVSHLGARNNLYALFIQDDVRLTPKLTLNLGLRYDPKLGLDEADNQHTTFVAGRQSTAFPLAPRGLLFFGDQGVEQRVIPNDWNNLAPRVGLAYQVMPRTVIRAAYGLFYDEYFGLMYNRTVQGQPWVEDATFNGMLSLSNPYGAAPVLQPVGYEPDPRIPIRDFSTYAAPTRDMRAGYLQNWNLVLEREIRGVWVARAAYVGSKGTALLNSIESNPGLLVAGATAGNINARRPYPRIGPMQLGISNGNSSYNSMQLTLQRRFNRGFSVLANYTWAKSLDYASYGSIEGNQTGPDPLNLRNNRGPSDFDVAHRFVASGMWELPRLSNHGRAVRTLLGGWQQNFILDIETGTPLTMRSGVDNDLNGVAGDFADYRGGDWRVSHSSRAEEIARWFNPSVFAVNAAGTIGSARRGQLRSPGLWAVDYSLFKNFRVTEKLTLQFRGEFFNFFNHTNLGDPVATVNSPGLGSINSAGSPRVVQLAVKLSF
ncbi:MAG: TonB-dependent receptor [Acidobacteria bacterium]|nr:TonB-dependent receptor [Acidobacteriota bacterium]